MVTRNSKSSSQEQNSNSDEKGRLGAKTGEGEIHATPSTQTLRGTSSTNSASKELQKKNLSVNSASKESTQKDKELVTAIRSKKGLETLDDNFVQQKVDKIFNANHILKRKFEQSASFAQFSRSKEYEELLKRIRKELRSIYGVFQSDRKGLFAALTNPALREEAIIKLLESHKSTKERVPHYDEIYKEICERISPSIVIDLGCGMNPLAYEHFVKNGIKPTIIASDISATDMELLTDAFKALEIPGETLPLDLTKEYEKLKDLHGDVTLLLKLLDSLEESHRHISYKIFDNIITPWIIASFPTKSIGGKKNIAVAGRTWFERLLKRKEMTWENFSVENELFYVIKNKS